MLNQTDRTEKAIRRRLRLQEESGTALLASTMLVVLLTGAGMAAVMTTSVSQNRSKNVLTSKQAFYLADAGIQHAKTLLPTDQSTWNTYAAYSTAQPLLTYPSLAGTGGYSVTVQGGGNGSLLLASTGTASGNAKAVVQSQMTLSTTTTTGPYAPRYAFITGKNLVMNVNASIQGGVPGTSGGVHANGNLTNMYSPTISSDFTASGSYTNAGTPTIGGTSGGSKPLETIPAISPTNNQTNFYASRDYLLASDGNVYDKNGAVQPTSGGKWYGWKYSAPTWTMSSNSTTMNGTLYVEGDAVISGTLWPSFPWITTIIATGSIDVSSKTITVRPPMSTDGALYKAATQNILFLAGGDLKLAPTSGGSAQFGGGSGGMALANEQVVVMGDSGFQFTGSIVAADAATSAPVVTGDNGLSYTGGAYTTIPTISYTGISNATLATAVTVSTTTGTVHPGTWLVTQW